MDENTNTLENTSQDEQTTDTTPDTSKDVDNKPDKEPEKKEKTFTQEQVNSFLKKEKLKWEKSAQKASEAEKLKSMSEEERKDAELEMLRKENEEYRRDKARKEMLDEVSDSLKSLGIDTAFSSFLVADDAENTKENIKAFSTAWETALEKAVNEKLAGKKPKTSSNTNNSNTVQLSEDIIRNMSPEDIIKNKQAVEAFLRNKK